jgi:Protein of unknown function (DUF2752)
LIVKTFERNQEEHGFREGSRSPPLRVDQRKFRAVMVAVIIGVLGGAVLLPIAPLRFFNASTCVFKSSTGLPCALCGGTRATHALLRGDLSRALYLNMAALPAVVALVAAALVLAYEALRGRVTIDWNALLLKFRSLLPILVALFCAYWLLHLSAALLVPKSELVDLRNPLANAIHKRFSPHTQ